MKKFIAFLLVLPLFACEKTIDFDGDIEDPVLVLGPSNVLSSGFGIGPNEDSLQLILSNSISILDNNEPRAIENGTVEIKENDGPWITMNSPFNGYFTASEVQPQPGNRYKVRASAPGYPSVSAECYVPEAVQIERIEFVEIVEPDSNAFEEGYAVYNLTFTDPGNGNHYYGISGEYRYQVPGFEPFRVTLTSTSPLAEGITDDNRYYFFLNDLFASNELFRGKTVTLPIRVFAGDFRPSQGDQFVFAIRLRTMDRPAYLYHTSRQRYGVYGGSDGPFSQPIQVYSNIENGLGFFGGYSETDKEED